MKCKKKYLIPDLIQNKLTQDELDIMKEHLNSCKVCSNEYLQLTELFGILKDQKQSEPSDSYWINLPVRIRSKIESKNVGFIRKYIPELAFSISVIAIFTVLIFKLFNNLNYETYINTDTELVSILDSIDKSDLLDYEENIINNNIEHDHKNGDEFVIKNIILTSNGIDEYIFENVYVNTLKEEEIKYLLTYLNQKNF